MRKRAIIKPLKMKVESRRRERAEMLESIKDSAESMEILESFCSAVFLWIASATSRLAKTIRGVLLFGALRSQRR